MRIRVAIIEDDPLFLRQEALFVERFGEQAHRDLTVTAFNSPATFLKGSSANFDILLLDILMPLYNGLTVAQEIRRFNPRIVILLITSAPQYAIRGYSVGALSYILKPLSWSIFKSEFARAIDQVLAEDRPTIMLQSGTKYLQVPHHEISYIESKRHKISVHTIKRDVTVPYTLSSLEERLVPFGFYRINSYYLVNMAHVEAVEGHDCLLDDGRELRISRARKRGFVKALTRYLSRDGWTDGNPSPNPDDPQ